LCFACNRFKHRCELRNDSRIDLIGFCVGPHTASWLLDDLQSHEIASDTVSSSLDTTKEYRFLIENKKFFILVDGKPQRELLNPPNSSDSVERKVRESLK
jgi:hypothetical protein